MVERANEEGIRLEKEHKFREKTSERRIGGRRSSQARERERVCEEILRDELSDVGHTIAQEPSFYYYGPVLIEGPLTAYWALGESLGPDTFVRKSPRDHNYL